MPFLPQTLNITKTRTVPHRTALHGTAPFRISILLSRPSTRPDCLLLLRTSAGVSSELSSMPQRLT